VASRFGYGSPTYDAEPADCAACPIHACVAFFTVTSRTSEFDLQFVHERAVTSELLVIRDLGDATLQPSTVAIASTAERAETKTVVDRPLPLPPLIGTFVSLVPWRWKTDTGSAGRQSVTTLLPACTPIAATTSDISHAILYERIPPFECPSAYTLELFTGRLLRRSVTTLRMNVMSSIDWVAAGPQQYPPFQVWKPLPSGWFPTPSGYTAMNPFDSANPLRPELASNCDEVPSPP